MTETGFLIFIVSIVAALIAIIVLIRVVRSPFQYPYKVTCIDVSGRRAPSVEDEIDKYLNEYGISIFKNHYAYVQQWKQDCRAAIQRSLLKKHRKRQFLNCVDDNNMFVFKLTRTQTRYQQTNYVRSPYHVSVVTKEESRNLAYLEERYQQLKAIGFECSLSQYRAKDQRRLMTKELRLEIMERDHYTCQMCGKYMPDGVGLQIDHIIPIAKGGKSVRSNLQVLCSKCNGSKSKNIL